MPTIDIEKARKRKGSNLLTEAQVRNAKPREKNYKLFDGGCLFLLITSQGAKYWRYKYSFAGKEKMLALGVYPTVSLSEAREERDKARKQLKNGADPGLIKKVAKVSKSTAENNFETITYEWYAKYSVIWKPSHSKRLIRLFERDVFPWIGRRPVSEITAPELLDVLRRIERRSVDTAHRALQNCGRIFRYAVATNRANRDPSGDLRGALAPVKENHYASIIDPKEIGALLRAIHSYNGYFVTQYALKLAPLVFVRPGELRQAEWCEFNLETAEWRIPAERMKMPSVHIVPLSKQAISILHELKVLTGNSKYVFPSVRTDSRPMSDNTVNAALRRLGYTSEEMTGHGFRSMASTILNEHGWNPDAIERQLAHAERNSIRAAYNYAEYLPERRKIMQYWADYLASLMNNKEVSNVHYDNISQVYLDKR